MFSDELCKEQNERRRSRMKGKVIKHGMEERHEGRGRVLLTKRSRQQGDKMIETHYCRPCAV